MWYQSIYELEYFTSRKDAGSLGLTLSSPLLASNATGAA